MIHHTSLSILIHLFFLPPFLPPSLLITIRLQCAVHGAIQGPLACPRRLEPTQPSGPWFSFTHTTFRTPRSQPRLPGNNNYCMTKTRTYLFEFHPQSTVWDHVTILLVNLLAPITSPAPIHLNHHHHRHHHCNQAKHDAHMDAIEQAAKNLLNAPNNHNPNQLQDDDTLPYRLGARKS